MSETSLPGVPPLPVAVARHVDQVCDRSAPRRTVRSGTKRRSGTKTSFISSAIRQSTKKTKRVQIDDHKPQRGKDAGEWNTYEVTCKSKQTTLWINGAVTATWNACEVPKGHVGLEAEYWYI